MSQFTARFPRKKIVLVHEPSPALALSYNQIAARFGLTIDFFPFTKKKRIEVSTFRKYKQKVEEHDGIIFTSYLVMNYFFELVRLSKIQISPTKKYFFPNKRLAVYLRRYERERIIKYLKRKIFKGEKGVEDLIPSFKKYKNDRYLFPCSHTKKTTVGDFLKKNNYAYTELPIYKVENRELPNNLLADYDMILFFTPSDIALFQKKFPEFQQPKQNIQVGTFGGSTTASAQALGWDIALKGLPGTSSMRDILENYLESF